MERTECYCRSYIWVFCNKGRDFGFAHLERRCIYSPSKKKKSRESTPQEKTVANTNSMLFKPISLPGSMGWLFFLAFLAFICGHTIMLVPMECAQNFVGYFQAWPWKSVMTSSMLSFSSIPNSWNWKLTDDGAIEWKGPGLLNER